MPKPPPPPPPPPPPQRASFKLTCGAKQPPYRSMKRDMSTAGGAAAAPPAEAGAGMLAPLNDCWWLGWPLAGITRPLGAGRVQNAASAASQIDLSTMRRGTGNRRTSSVEMKMKEERALEQGAAVELNRGVLEKIVFKGAMALIAWAARGEPCNCDTAACDAR